MSNSFGSSKSISMLKLIATCITFGLYVLINHLQPAAASELHPSVVSRNAVNYTPQLVTTVTVPSPHIDAIGQVGNFIFAGGLFDLVSRADGTTTFARQNFVAFNAFNGVLRSEAIAGYVDPVFDDQIWALATYGNSVFVGGSFDNVNGASHPRLVKINASTGAIDAVFDAGINGGIVWDLRVWSGPDGNTPMLIVAGSFSKKLVALDLRTGQDTNYMDLVIADAIPNAWGDVAVNHIAINNAGTKLAATGNFRTVQGLSRTRMFLANLTPTGPTVDPWYYPGFAKSCASIEPRRIAYLQGIDFSPDGSYFVVTATGQVPKTRADIWPAGLATYHTVCDAAGRFNLSDSQKPVWINYTGGDSIWSTAVTGAAVYVQGHFKWLDNPNGRASQNGGGAVERFGVGAINPVTGKALPWNPAKPGSIGGKTFLVTPTGLWIGSDSKTFDGEPHQGIAFAPLPTTLVGAGDIGRCGSTNDEDTAALLSTIPGVVFTLGNNAYTSGTTAQFNSCYDPGWGQHLARTKPSPGDRDYFTTGAAGYFDYFGAAAGDPAKGYYSFDKGYWHIIVLNSMCEWVGGCGATSPMITWLKSDLAANTEKCTLAYFHHPLFSSGADGSNSKMRSAWNALYSARADVILSGHDNNYERFALQRPDGELNTSRGIRQFVVGTGGAQLRPLGVTKPNSEVRNADTYGVLKLTLHPASYDWQFIPTPGGTFTDSGSGNCN